MKVNAPRTISEIRLALLLVVYIEVVLPIIATVLFVVVADIVGLSINFQSWPFFICFDLIGAFLTWFGIATFAHYASKKYRTRNLHAFPILSACVYILFDVILNIWSASGIFSMRSMVHLFYEIPLFGLLVYTLTEYYCIHSAFRLTEPKKHKRSR